MGMNYPDRAGWMRATYLEKRQFRFYRIIITQTLFGLWALIREWGRIRQPRHRSGGVVRQRAGGFGGGREVYEAENEARIPAWIIVSITDR